MSLPQPFFERSRLEVTQCFHFRRWSRGRRDLLSGVYRGGWGLSSQCRDALLYAAVVREPKAAGPGAGLQTTRRMLEYLSSAILRRPISYEIRRKSYISSLKAL